MRIKTPAEVEAMRQGGRMLATVLDKLKKELAAGMNTKELSDMALAEIKRLGGRPAFLGHKDFPEALCTSINHEIVHGLPSKKKVLKNGDVIGLDFGVFYKSLYVDSAITEVVGGNYPNTDVKRLIEGTKEALAAGITAIKGGGTRVGDISAAVQDVLNKYKLGIIRDLVGHAVGDDIHEEPNIPNYGARGTGPILPTGVTIAIEPMASLGDWHIQTGADGWTVEMVDGSLGAHFEHTVLVTEKGAEILTVL
ncbi:type I methionyl aminopeptidase [Candidatus Saccharibacteria bacterium RIFCSPHIGHO2_12_FULL_47_16b]|nr:MAG: type I methionyl aminopeptidase [Candidatus Saccharibacteria bacterium RIFCSPHIGHO2_12_FULL_47_16b]